MKRIIIIIFLSIFFICFKTKAEKIDYGDYYGTHLAYELNTETKEATLGCYRGYFEGNPISTAPCVHWEDTNNYYEYFRNLVIPETIKYRNVTYTITAIAPYAFYGESGIETIKLPETISSIGHYAFCGCINLTKINIPNNVTSIQPSTFLGCI